jgi:hypothetical protein
MVLESLHAGSVTASTAGSKRTGAPQFASFGVVYLIHRLLSPWLIFVASLMNVAKGKRGQTNGLTPLRFCYVRF